MPLKRSVRSSEGIRYSNNAIESLRENTASDIKRISSDAHRIRERFEEQLTKIKDEKMKSSVTKK